MSGEVVPLSQLKVGERGVIKKIKSTKAVRQRLLAMGLVKGETIRVHRIAPLGDPIDFVIKEYHLSLRKSESAKVLVEKV
ncbi:MAG: FeoA family protein [Anaerolineales bacterium]